MSNRVQVDRARRVTPAVYVSADHTAPEAGISAPGTVTEPSVGREFQAFSCLLFVVLAFITYFPLIVSEYFGIGQSFFVVLFLLNVCLGLRLHGSSLRFNSREGVLFFFHLAFTVYAFVAYLTMHDATMKRYILIFPLALLVGYLAASSGMGYLFIISFIGVGLLSSVLAVVESLRGASLFGFSKIAALNATSRGFRAFVGSDQPLVLATLLVLAITLAGFAVRSYFVLIPVCATLLVGVWCTGSRLPMLLAICAVVGCVSLRQFKGSCRAISATIATAYLLTLAFGIYSILFVWSNAQVASDNASASSAYRPGLYSLIPQVLNDVPLGVGFGAVQTQHWFVYMNGSRLDISHSIDAEPVLLAVRFGWLGLIMFLVVSLICVRMTLRDAGNGVPPLIVLACCLSLALTAWETLGVAFFVVLGIGAFWHLNSRVTASGRVGNSFMFYKSSEECKSE